MNEILSCRTPDGQQTSVPNCIDIFNTADRNFDNLLGAVGLALVTGSETCASIDRLLIQNENPNQIPALGITDLTFCQIDS